MNEYYMYFMGGRDHICVQLTACNRYRQIINMRTVQIFIQTDFFPRYLPLCLPFSI